MSMATNTDPRFDPRPTTDSILRVAAPFPDFDTDGDFERQIGVRDATRTSIETAIEQEAGR